MRRVYWGHCASLSDVRFNTYTDKEENQSHATVTLRLKVTKSFFPLSFLSRVTHSSLICIWHHCKHICDVTHIYRWQAAEKHEL